MYPCDSSEASKLRNCPSRKLRAFSFMNFASIDGVSTAVGCDSSPSTSFALVRSLCDAYSIYSSGILMSVITNLSPTAIGYTEFGNVILTDRSMARLIFRFHPSTELS